MSSLSRNLALDHIWIYKPEDVLAIFIRFDETASLDLSICEKYPQVNSIYLIDEWSSKNCEDLLAITYMCANHAIPILHFYNKKENQHEFREHLKIFVLDPFKALEKYFTKPNEIFTALHTVRNKIAKDYYWDKNMEYLEDQVLYCLGEFGKLHR